MKATFDILSEPWIPVVGENETTGELGLLETLERAHRLRAVQDPSPLVEYSVYRFLVVFLMDMLRPEDTQALEELLEEGRFDPDRIRDYVALCRLEGVSFDLFDEKRPFLQTAYRGKWDRKPKPISTLDYSTPKGNNHIHFHHQQERTVYTPGKAIRMMLTAQIFCVHEVQDYPSNVNGAPPWFALIQGESLFQTLVLGMLDLDHIGIPFDRPPVLWRNTEEVEAKKLVAQTSWLFGMLFPARRVHLIPDDNGSTVSQVYFSQGMNYQVTNAWTDPHVAYRISDNGRFNWKPSEDESIWRNLACLIDLKQAPQIVSQYTELDQPDGALFLTLYGIQTSQASYLRSQRYDLQLPNRLLGNDDALRYITNYIARAERLGNALYKSLPSREKENAHTKYYCPKEISVQTMQRFYAECEQLLWKELEALTQPDVDYTAHAEQIREMQIRSALDCADWALGQLNLRGRAMVQIMEAQEKNLQKTIAAIRKRGGEIMNQERMTAFFARLDALPKGERTALKREAGVMLEQADGRAVQVFYQCLPVDASPWQEGRMFAAACIHCLWEPETRSRQPLEQIFFRLGQDQTISKSMGHRLETLLDLAWDEDGFLLTKLFRLVQLARSKGYAVDCERLLNDLLYWNGEKQTVQRRWAKALYIKPETNHDGEKGE